VRVSSRSTLTRLFPRNDNNNNNNNNFKIKIIVIYICDNNSNEMIKQYKEEKKRLNLRTNSSLLHFHFLSIILKLQSQKKNFQS